MMMANNLMLWHTTDHIYLSWQHKCQCNCITWKYRSPPFYHEIYAAVFLLQISIMSYIAHSQLLHICICCHWIMLSLCILYPFTMVCMLSSGHLSIVYLKQLGLLWIVHLVPSGLFSMVYLTFFHGWSGIIESIFHSVPGATRFFLLWYLP